MSRSDCFIYGVVVGVFLATLALILIGGMGD